jgi:hypothetical protein
MDVGGDRGRCELQAAQDCAGGRDCSREGAVWVVNGPSGIVLEGKVVSHQKGHTHPNSTDDDAAFALGPRCTAAKPHVHHAPNFIQRAASSVSLVSTSPTHHPASLRQTSASRLPTHTPHLRIATTHGPTSAFHPNMSARVQQGGRPGGSRFAQFKLVLLGRRCQTTPWEPVC